MSMHELARWVAYRRVAGPLGVMRGDMRTALVASTLANVWRGKGRALRLDEFMLFPEQRVQSEEEMIAKAKSITRMFGGTVKSDGNDD